MDEHIQLCKILNPKLEQTAGRKSEWYTYRWNKQRDLQTESAAGGLFPKQNARHLWDLRKLTHFTNIWYLRNNNLSRFPWKQHTMVFSKLSEYSYVWWSVADKSQTGMYDICFLIIFIFPWIVARHQFRGLTAGCALFMCLANVIILRPNIANNYVSYVIYMVYRFCCRSQRCEIFVVEFSLQ